MYFKLMNGRETYLEGMRELLEERHHQVISEDAGDRVDPVLNGGLETPVEVWMELIPEEESGPENHVVLTDYGCEMAGGLKRGKAVLRACGKTFLFRALMTLVRELEKQVTMHAGASMESYSHRENVYLDKNGIMLDCSRNSVLNVETIKKYIRFAGFSGNEYDDALYRGYL